MALRKTYADPGKLSTVEQIAERAGVSVKTIRRAIAKGGPFGLAHVRLGNAAIRISDEQYADWVRRCSKELEF